MLSRTQNTLKNFQIIKPLPLHRSELSKNWATSESKQITFQNKVSSNFFLYMNTLLSLLWNFSSVFGKSNSFLSDLECLEKCFGFLGEFRRRLGCLLKLSVCPQREIETVLLIWGLWRQAALPETSPPDFNHALCGLFTSTFFFFSNFINYTLHCLIFLRYNILMMFSVRETS